MDRGAFIMQTIFSFIQPYISLSFSPDGKMTHLFHWPAKQAREQRDCCKADKEDDVLKQWKIFLGSDDGTLLVLVNTLHSFSKFSAWVSHCLQDS